MFSSGPTGRAVRLWLFSRDITSVPVTLYLLSWINNWLSLARSARVNWASKRNHSSSTDNLDFSVWNFGSELARACKIECENVHVYLCGSVYVAIYTYELPLSEFLCVKRKCERKEKTWHNDMLTCQGEWKYVVVGLISSLCAAT